MKQLLLLIVLVIAGMAGYSQGSLGKSDPDAKRILDAVSAKFKTYKSVQATFTMKDEDAKGAVLGIKKGTVMMKGSRYHVIINGGQEIFCDGVTTWTFDKSSNEVTITKVDPSVSTLSLQKLFTNFYDKDFLYKLNGDKALNKKMLYEIEMTPVDKSKQFHTVYLLIDKQTNTIYSTKVLNNTGDVLTYTINTFNGKVNLDDKLFTFDKSKYPGVEEVDLR